MGDEFNGIYQYLNSREKAALYRLEPSLDLKDLEEPEQQLLLAVLYQLADDEGDKLTDYQRAFIRSVQRYMGITNPQTSADLTAVGDIDSLDVQKAFLRVAFEFFYLQEGEEITEDQEDFLGNFSVNKKQAGIIENSVSRLYNSVGAEGVAEKYGFAPIEEPEASEPKENGEPSGNAEMSGEKTLPASDRTTAMAEADKMEALSLGSKIFSNIGMYETYVNRHVIMNKSVMVDGTAIFRNCVIDLQRGASFQCRTEDKQKECKVIFDCCVFVVPKSFPGTEAKNSLGFRGKIHFSNCTFIEAYCSFSNSQIHSSTFTGCPSISIYSGVLGCSILSECSFSDCKNIKAEQCPVEKCSFSHCEAFTADNTVSDCSFTSCGRISINGTTKHCKFLNSHDFNFENIALCDFKEISSSETPIYLDGRMDSCTFDGVTLKNDAYLVAPNTDTARLVRCTFKDIQTSRLDRKLFEEEFTTYHSGFLFACKKKEVHEFADLASCKLLNDIQLL